jgi:hypothetical protein
VIAGGGGIRKAARLRAFRRGPGLGYHRGVWLTLALLTCLSIDFSNPLLPGVVRFDDSESVYAVRAERPRTDERSAPAELFPALRTRSTDLVIAPPRAALVASERPRPVPAAMRPRGLPSAPTAPASVAGEDH